MIEENDGFWPESLNDHTALRKHLHFNDIIVSFSGTANVSGSSVYAQKVYDYADVNVGYTFACMLARERNHVVLDARLLNDVREQLGGGAEPLRDHAVDRNLFAEAATILKDGTKAIKVTTQAVTDGAVETTKAVYEAAVGAVNNSGAGETAVHVYAVATDTLTASSESLTSEVRKLPNRLNPIRETSERPSRMAAVDVVGDIAVSSKTE